MSCMRVNARHMLWGDGACCVCVVCECARYVVGAVYVFCEYLMCSSFPFPISTHFLFLFHFPVSFSFFFLSLFLFYVLHASIYSPYVVEGYPAHSVLHEDVCVCVCVCVCVSRLERVLSEPARMLPPLHQLKKKKKKKKKKNNKQK